MVSINDNMHGVDATELVLRLRVVNARFAAEDVLALTLAQAEGGALPTWLPGAHIAIRLPSGQMRSYSLCGEAGAGTYEIAVLREPFGRGASAEVHRDQMVGCVIAASVPHNDFELIDAPQYLFIAGGIGITPLLPMARSITRAAKPWSFLYLGRSRRRMSYLVELERLASSANARSECFAADEGGRIVLSNVLSEVASGCAVYCCGPQRLLEEAETLHAANAGTYTLSTERFGRPGKLVVTDSTPATQSPLSPIAESSGLRCEPGATFEVELRKTGVTLQIASSETILAKVRQVRSGLTYSCSSGYCGTCETRVISGIPDHRDEVLSQAERATNQTMMICVGRSLTKRLVLDL